MSEWKAKRFWKASEVVEAQDKPGFIVQLDGRILRTPAKAELIAPTLEMAQEIAAEWDAQEGVINPNTMPFTRSANAAIDKVRIQHAEVADMIADYGDSDLLCYRADAPEELIARQAGGWNPILDWAEKEFGTRLTVHTGVIHSAQPANAIAILRDKVHALGPFQLTAIHDLVSLSGSLILGLACARGAIDPDEAWALSVIDDTWQQEQWGADEEATKMAAIKRDSFLHAKRFFDLSGDK